MSALVRDPWLYYILVAAQDRKASGGQVYYFIVTLSGAIIASVPSEGNSPVTSWLPIRPQLWKVPPHGSVALPGTKLQTALPAGGAQSITSKTTATALVLFPLFQVKFRIKHTHVSYYLMQVLNVVSFAFILIISTIWEGKNLDFWKLAGVDTLSSVIFEVLVQVVSWGHSFVYLGASSHKQCNSSRVPSQALSLCSWFTSLFVAYMPTVIILWGHVILQ